MSKPSSALLPILTDPADLAGATDSKSSGTPLPWKAVGVVGCCLFANSFGSLVIFPFLPFMVQDFFPELRPDQLGRYAGLLGSAFHLGGFVGSIVWGRLADRYGRRPALIAGLIGTMVSILAFGLSSNFTAALVSRFMWGLLNGNIGVAKAYLCEICDDSNQAQGFSTIGIFSGVGRLFGPACGAFLTNTAKQWPGSFLDTSFNAAFPYFLPCGIGAVVSLVSLVIAVLYLKETRSTDNRHADRASEIPSTLFTLVRDPRTGLATLFYGAFCFIDIARNEIMPLWLLTNRAVGGLNYTTVDIGITIVLLGPFQILLQAVFYAPLVSRYSYRGVVQVSLVVYAIAASAIPFVTRHNIDHAAEAPDLLSKTLVQLFMFCIQGPAIFVFTSSFVFINNSCAGKDRATANGIGQTYASFFRIIGPAIGGYLFAWSELNTKWPFDYHFMWHTLTVCCLILLYLVKIMPRDVEVKYRADHVN